MEQYETDLEPPNETTMKNKKVPGEDSIPSEIFNLRFPALLNPLTRPFRGIWDSKNFPMGWVTFSLLPIPKKDDKTVCVQGNIGLIDMAAKLITTVLLNLFVVWGARTSSTQCGFYRERGRFEQIYTLR